jgi:hypothetical protein
MKDAWKETLESSRPDKDAMECIDFCLQQLYADNEHGIEDSIVFHLTFEELIGALLLAKDELARLTNHIENAVEYLEGN